MAIMTMTMTTMRIHEDRNVSPSNSAGRGTAPPMAIKPARASKRAPLRALSDSYGDAWNSDNSASFVTAAHSGDGNRIKGATNQRSLPQPYRRLTHLMPSPK